MSAKETMKFKDMPMIISNTTKSIATFLKEDLLEINEFREKMKQRLEDLHPSLRKRISVAVATRLNFGDCFVCETVEKIGKWLSCKVPTTE